MYYNVREDKHRGLNTLKLVSWNVNGLRACLNKGFLDFFRQADSDIFCIQETKLQEGQVELDLEGYQHTGTALSKGLFRTPSSPGSTQLR